MALLSALVKAIAEVEGIDEAQVGWVARHLREAGQISQAGRGRGAAHMSNSDATNLLIGINAAANAKNGAEAVNIYRNLPCCKSNLLDNLGLSDVFNIGKKFGKSLEQLIELAKPLGDRPSKLQMMVFSRSLFFRCVKEIDLETVTEKHLSRMNGIIISEIIFRRPYPNVTVRITDSAYLENDVEGITIREDDRTLAEVEFWDRAAEWPFNADRDERIRISFKTLLGVGSMLSK